MIMDVAGRGKAMGGVKNSLVSGDYRLEVRMHRGCLNGLNRMELGNNARMTFFSSFSIRWELMISGEPVVMPWNLYCCPSYWNCKVRSLKSMVMGLRVCNHSTLRTMSQPPMSIENI
jgi:hypothetical protein